MIFFYNIILLILFPFYIVFFFFASIFIKKWRKGFFVKLGLYSERVAEKHYVFHCVSVGETLATIPLLKKFLSEIDKNVIFTVTTKTGYEVATQRLSSDVKKIFFFPLDFPFSVIRFIISFKVKAFIISETEIWPNLIYFSKIFKIPIIFINGRISDKSFQRYKKFRWFLRSFIGYPNFIMQNNEYKNRILALGADGNRVFVSGNIKYDQISEDKGVQRKDLGINDNDIVILAGSTHEGEEKIIIETFLQLKTKYKQLKLIIAPRHPERFKDVENLFLSMKICYGKRSKSAEVKDVYLLDTIGELFSCYNVCDIAFVGGSLVDVGGHNILEPAYFGKPVVFGRYMHNFKDIRDEFLKNEAGFEVDVDNLSRTFEKMICDKELLNEMGKRSKAIVKNNRGSLSKTLDLIREILTNVRK